MRQQEPPAGKRDSLCRAHTLRADSAGSRTWVGPGGETHRMEPELDNGSVVELVYLAAHGDEAVAVLNLLDVFFPGRLCGDLTEHRLGGRAVCEPTQEGARSARWSEKKRGISRREVGNGGKVEGGEKEEKNKA